MTEQLREGEFETRQVTAYIEAPDSISRAGLATQLQDQDELIVVDEATRADVAILVVESIDEDAARQVRAMLREGAVNVAVIATTLDDNGVLRAVEAGACAILRRVEATPEHVAEVLSAAVQGHGTLPPDLLGSLLSQVGRLQRTVLQPRGILLNGFSEREIEVLRLVADGYDTDEVATRLSYSERTVKNVIHDVTSRFNLRNRCHAVAYALRAGVI